MNIRMNENDERTLRELAEQRGKPVDDLAAELLHEVLEKKAREGNGSLRETKNGETQPRLNAYEVARREGVIGMVKDGPSDLSTNPKHMEGFGESGS